MGTHGYMAPEMVKLLGQKRFERVGYTELIDYWSLGVTVYKLLSGKRPFDKKKFEKLLEEQGEEEDQNRNKEYALLLQEVKYPEYFSRSATSLIGGLLEVDEKKRLGSTGIENIKEHKFFKTIDWDKLMQKHVIPPVVPSQKTYPTKIIHKDFDNMMATLTKQRRANGSEDVNWGAEIAESDNQLFSTWDFISPHTLKVEMGIGGEMEAHDTNFKVRREIVWITIHVHFWRNSAAMLHILSSDSFHSSQIQQIIGSEQASPKEPRRSILGSLTPLNMHRSVKNVLGGDNNNA
jgi:serine/threonine protein kinase